MTDKHIKDALHYHYSRNTNKTKRYHITPNDSPDKEKIISVGSDMEELEHLCSCCDKSVVVPQRG